MHCRPLSIVQGQAPRPRRGHAAATTLLALALLTSNAATSAETKDRSAANAEEEAGSTEETVVVVATRTERQLDEVAATVSVKTAEEIEAELVRDIADLVRFEPGVSVAGTGSRFGLSGFSIRGIGGNRVLTLVDGVRVPDEFSFGPFLSARRDFVDVDSLSRMEIARGPVSALWGSDALGGVVALTTKDAHRRLGERPFSAAFKGGYSSADDSTVATLDLAAGQGPLAGMVLYTHRAGSETENAGATGGTGAMREQPDPQNASLDNLATRLAYKPSERHRLTLGVDLYAADTATRILSDYGSVVFGTTVDRRDADDSKRRRGGSLAYRYRGDWALADAAEITLYQQRSETEQRTREERTTPRRAKQTRRRDSQYEQRIQGLAAQFQKSLVTGAVRHTLSYGVDYLATGNAGLRDGGTFDANGAPQREFSPLPTRDFPITDVTQSALFAQDEIELFDGALLLSPGVRFDRFDADAQADSIYLNGNPGSPTPADYDAAEATAKIGAVYRLTSAFSAYAGYSEGFRAPPYDDVNVGFSNFLGGYKTIANAELESERSRGVEAGLRFANGALELQWALYRNDYEDFIESFAVAPRFAASRGIDPADGLLTFQSINRASVRIQGSELRAAFALPSGLFGRTAVAYASGDDRSEDQPLSSVEPLTAIVGLGYEAPGGRWGGELICSMARGKDAADIDPADARPATAGYGVLDLLAHVQLGSRTRLNVGLFNLADKTYIRWTDSAAIGGDAAARFTQPGFNAGVTLRAEF